MDRNKPIKKNPLIKENQDQNQNQPGQGQEQDLETLLKEFSRYLEELAQNKNGRTPQAELNVYKKILTEFKQRFSTILC